MRELALVLFAAICAQAAVPKEVQALADEARGLPPEFAADVLLKLVASPLAADVRWKRDAIEDAFRSAASAPAPYRLHLKNPRAGTADFLATGANRLALQAQAILAMLAIDPQNSLYMFQAIGPLELPPLPCEVAATPDVSAYYDTAAQVFKRAFTAPQRVKGDDIQFLRQILSAVRSPSQVVPALKLLDQVSLSGPERSDLVALFSSALDHIHGSDREFGALEPLLVSAAVPEMHETPAFMGSLRNYIVRQTSGSRCSDQIKPGELSESARGFNTLISRIDRSGAQFRPITLDESTPAKDDGTYQPDKLDVPLLPEMKPPNGSTPVADWVAKALAAVEAVETPQSEISWHAIAVDYEALLSATVPGPLYQRVCSSALHFLEREYDGQKNHGLWLYHYRQLFNRNRISDPWLLDQLIHSRNPVISVYGQLQKLTGAS